MKVYVASGFFNDRQIKACIELELVADTIGETFKPRVMNLGKDGCDWQAVFDENVKHLKDCDLVLASTVDKDVGSIWETGYASALGKKIIYYTPGIDRPNLMLAFSGQVARTLDELYECVKDPSVSFVGDKIE